MAHRRQEYRERRVGIKGRRHQRPRVTIIDGFATARHLMPTHRVRMDDTFGRSRGSAGINDVERIRRGGWRSVPDRAFFCHPVVQRRMIVNSFVQHDDVDIAKGHTVQIGQFCSINEQMHRP